MTNGKEQYLIEFVDHRNILSLIAEAMAKRHIKNKYAEDLASKVKVNSSGIEVRALTEARNALRRPSHFKQEKAAGIIELAGLYIKLADQRLFVPNLGDIENPDPYKSKQFFQHIGGDIEKRTLRYALKERGLSKYVPVSRVDHPQQTKKSNVERFVIALNTGSRIGAVRYAGIEDLIGTLKTASGAKAEIEDPVFTQYDTYSKILDSLRAPVEKVVDDYMAKRP